MTAAGGPPGGVINPYAPPAAAIEAADQRPGEARGFRSVTTLARGISIVMLAHVAIQLLSDGACLYAIQVMERVAANQPFEQSELSAIDTRALAIQGLAFVNWIIGVVLFCMFMVRANRNARAFGSPMSITPGWAAGYFFVPIASLWRPYAAMKEIWQGSDPDRDPHTFNLPVPALLPWWWGAWLVHNFVGGVYQRLSKQAPDSPAAYIRAAWTDIVMSVFPIVAALLAAAVVRAVARRQDERHRRQGAAAGAPSS